VLSTFDLVEALLFPIRFKNEYFCVTDNAAKSVKGRASPALPGERTYRPFVWYRQDYL